MAYPFSEIFASTSGLAKFLRKTFTWIVCFKDLLEHLILESVVHQIIKGRKIRLSEKKPFRVLKMSHVFFPTMPGLCNNVQWKRWQILELSIALISWISFLNFWKNGKRRVTGELEICEIIQIGWKNSQVCSIWFYFGKVGGKNPKTCDCLVLIPWKQVWIHWLAEK